MTLSARLCMMARLIWSFFCWATSPAGSGSGVRDVVSWCCLSLVRAYISNASD